MLFLLACLQPVESTSEPSTAQLECEQSCAIQVQACAQERDCAAQCTTLTGQLESGMCLSLAEELWQCHQVQTWTCVDDVAQQENATACASQEEAYLLCFVPEDTGSTN